MTVRIERSFEVAAPPADVWEFIADPANRADAISVVSSYTVGDEAGHVVTWQVELPIPFVRRTVPVHTEDVTRRPPEYVEFVGRSTAMDVRGEHEVEATETGTRLHNRFVVDGKLPGVERFFKHSLDDELENLRRHLERDLQRTG